jgi:predicted neuraminidase
MQGYLNRSFSMEIDNERMHTADAAGAQTSKWNAMNAASLTNDEGRTMKKGLCCVVWYIRQFPTASQYGSRLPVLGCNRL